MNDCTRCFLALLLAATGLLLSACRIPISELPLTSETPSPIDERLVGTWEVDMSAIREGSEEQLETYIVRWVKDDPRRLELIAMHDGQEQTADAMTLVTCHFAMHDYLSVGPDSKEEGKGYFLCHYWLDDADHGRIYLMDSDFMIDAIERGLIAGQVSRDGVQIRNVAIEASVQELRRFIEKHSPDCFAMKTPIKARRVK